MIANGSSITNQDERISVVLSGVGSELIINDAKIEDAGEYMCKVREDPPLQLSHTVIVKGKTIIC